MKSIRERAKAKVTKLIGSLGVLMVCSSVNATLYSLTEKVHILSTSDAQIMDDAGGISTLRLANNTLSAGSCFKGSSNYLVMYIRDNSMGERMYTMLLAAQMAGLTVQVTVDDQHKTTSGHCYVQRVRIEP